MIARFAVAITLFLLAFDRGSYYLPSRNSLAIAVWWAIILGLAIGVVPRGRLPRVSVLTGGLLAALAVVTVASMAWAASAEKAFAEFNRVALYLGIFALVTLVSKRADLPRWADGIATAVAAIGLLALTSRLFPGAFPSGDIPRFLPAVQTRLSYPVGYWNGLAILMALGAPVLLRAAVASRRAWARGLAVGVLPALACVVYLASSRGGVAAAGVGICVFLALTSSRWAAVAALGVAALGSWAAIAVLVSRFELVNGPLESDTAAAQGRSAAVLILLTCVAAGLVYATGGRLLPRSTRPHPLVGRVDRKSVV